MTTVYKLTDSKSQTKNQTQWGENITHTADGGDHALCSEYWLHAYRDPLTAILLNPAHGGFDAQTMQLWECEAEIGKDAGDKIGCTKITTLRQIPLPQVTTTQRCAFAILIAKELFGVKNQKWDEWASNWLANKNNARSKAAAEAAAAAAAAEAAAAAAEAAAAAWAAAEAAAWAAAAASAKTDFYPTILRIAQQATQEF
jgi:hypothetical protein